MNPIANPVEAVDRAFLYIIGFAFVLLFLITATMLFFVFRYSRKRNPVPADIRGNLWLETAWMLLPTLIALSMFYFGWQAYLGLRNVPPGALQIGVRGEMFFWTFIYPNGKQADRLIVPVGQPVKLNISSLDVIHSLFIPAFRVKADAVRGLDTYAWFYPQRKGTFTIACAEYCGTGHSDMYADLKVVSPAEYEAWLALPEEGRPVPENAGLPPPEVLQKFDPAGMHRVGDAMTFRWRIDADAMHVRLRAPALGWVGIGFNPDSAMKGADFVIGYVKDEQVFVSDEYGTDLIEHKSDESVGGRRTVTNVFGTEENGFTEIAFSMPLDSGEMSDRRLVPDADTVVLLAYSATMDNFRSQHGYRVGYKVNLSNGQSRGLQ